MSVRVATHQDIPAIVELARLMRDESNYQCMDFSDEVMTDTLATMIRKGQFVVVAEQEGKIVGGMLGMLAQSWFGKDWIATDMGLFMHPEHRGSRDAVRMIAGFVAWAKAGGVRQIRPGVSTGNITAQRLYEGLGFERAGGLFVMNIQGEGDGR